MNSKGYTFRETDETKQQRAIPAFNAGQEQKSLSYQHTRTSYEGKLTLCAIRDEVIVDLVVWCPDRPAEAILIVNASVVAVVTLCDTNSRQQVRRKELHHQSKALVKEETSLN